MSTRSTLRSRNSECGAALSEVFAAIPEELEEPDLQLADVGVFGDSGEFVAEYHPPSHSSTCGKRPVVHCSQVASQSDIGESGLRGDSQEDEYDYDGGAADDLALRMDVPPPGSDEESEEECQAPHPVLLAAESKPKAPCQPRGVVRPPRKKTSRGADKAVTKTVATGHSLDKDWLSNFDADLAALEAKPLDEATQKVEILAGELQGQLDSQMLQVVPRLLRGTLRLMDRQEADVHCLLRLARCALDLLCLMVAAGEDAGSDGMQAAYLNIAKALFKLSKEAGNDALFRSAGLLDSLLGLLASPDVQCKSSDLRIFVLGIFKNVTNNEDNLKHITKRGILPTLQALMKACNHSSSPGEAQQLVQITALLRNLAASSKRNQQIVELGIISDLTRISAQYRSDQELQTNIARILAKLSLHDAPCEAFEADASHISEVLQCLSTHADVSSIVLRLAFFLGNLTARSDRLRELFWFECGGAALLPNLLQKYWQRDRRLAQTDVESLARGADVQECEGVLVKLIRLAANAAISRGVGIELAASPAIADLLLDVLGCKRMTESEELVLNTMAATTNLLFYGEQANGNLLFSAESKELLCRLLRPLLLESYNVEALIEAARALGNLSRHQDARQWIAELRVDEILAILLAHSDRDLVFYACGALVNMAADTSHGSRLCSQVGLRLKLATVLRDAPADDMELQLVAVKVLSNLRAAEDDQAAWAEGELDTLLSALSRVESEQGKHSAIDCHEAAIISSSLSELVGKLRDSLDSLQPCTEAGQQNNEAWDHGKRQIGGASGYSATVQPPQA